MFSVTFRFLSKSINIVCFSLAMASLWSCENADTGLDRKWQNLTFEDFVAQLEEEDSAQQIVDAYMDTLSQAPVVEDTVAYFLYHGTATSIQTAGDFSSWQPGSHFTQVANTTLWYKKMTFESIGRFDYKLVVNGKWILDPLNPFQIGGGFGSNSELRMADYEHPQEIIERTDVAQGGIEKLSLPSSHTGKSYTIHVYTPANYTADGSYPAVYFQDGEDYINLANTPTVLDNLIADQSMAPVIAVFVTPTDRTSEYAFGLKSAYQKFFTEELVSYIDANYATESDPSRRAVIGDSYGGNISALISFNYPEVFGNCGIHSGAFQANNFETNGVVMDGVKKNVKVASIWGSYEGASLPANMHRLKDYLQDHGNELYWKELPEGHSWGLWRATQDDMLTFFFPFE